MEPLVLLVGVSLGGVGTALLVYLLRVFEREELPRSEARVRPIHQGPRTARRPARLPKAA